MVGRHGVVARRYEQAGRTELATQEREEIEIIMGFMPKQMDEAEVAAAIKAVIAETGAASVKDMGKVMGAAKSQLSGKADMGMVSSQVKAALSK